MEISGKGKNMRVTKSFRKEDYKEGKKVIIYGAGRYGELAYWMLKELNIKPFCFADEKMAGDKFCDLKVISPNELKDYLDAIVLVSSYNYFLEMVSNLQSIGFESIYDILELLKLECSEANLSEYLLDEKHNWQKYANVVDNADNNKVIINHCELVVTECCTLKCKDCANLMQYYQHPENLDERGIKKYFNYFLDSIDMLLELRILGGEPFIIRDLDSIINEFVYSEKIKRITIYTNSTILPSEKVIRALQNKKISVHMSNYGAVSKKINELKKVFIENHINYYIHNYDKWLDLGNVNCRNYNGRQMVELYKNCMMAKCYSFYRGKLYICPRSAHGEQLGIFSNSNAEFVDFTKEENLEDRRKQIVDLITKVKFLTACNYCNGSASESNVIDAAIQMR